MASAGLAAGLIDTDVLIDAERGHPDAVAFLTTQQAASGVRLSIVSAMELVVGCRNATALAHVRQFLQHVTVMPIDVAISQAAYALVETFFLSHGLLIPDALIAATALGHGLTLYTKNVRHFQMIPQLTVVRPYP
jgi:predicted nucleic acid-binding protein